MVSTPKAKELFLASSLRDGLEDNNINQVATLLQCKEADPNVLLPMHGITPFHLVIGNESETFAEEVTRLFLRHGGDPNVKSVDGMTPVHVAAAWGRINVLELLLANGGDPLCLDDDGRSPFHYAFDGSYYDAIALLGKYCTKRQEEDDLDDASDEPKIQIKLEKILVNRGDVVAEYVPSEIDLTEDSMTSSTLEDTQGQTTTSEARESSTTSPDDLNSLSTSPEDLKRLQTANITFRKRRSAKNKENSPKNQVQNSEDTYEIQKSCNDGKNMKQLAKNKQISPINRVDTPETLFDREKTYTKRKIQDFDLENEERSFAEEKILIGEIINRLSDSFNKAEKENFNLKEKENGKIDGKKKFCSLLPQPKFFKKNLETPKRKEKFFPAYLENSIISTSPNFNIKNLKREETTPRRRDSGKYNFTPKNFGNSSVRKSLNTTPRIRSASSTPKRKAPVSKVAQSHRNREKEQNKHINKTYNKNNNVFFPSPDVEDNLKMVNRRLSKDFVKNLEKTFDDEFEAEQMEKNNDRLSQKSDNSTEKKDSPKKITPKYAKISSLNNNNNNIDLKRMCNSPLNKLPNNNKLVTSPKSSKPSKKLTEGREKEKKFDPNRPIKSENKRKFFIESPGSSNPRSLTSSPKRESTGEELQLWNEIDEIYLDKGKTPPASVSRLTEGSFEGSLESSTLENTSLMTEEAFDETNAGKCCGQEKTYEDESSMNSDVFQTPMRSSASSKGSVESFFSVDEEYAYVDPEKHVAFLERRLRVLPPSQVEDMNNVKNESTWIGMLERLSLASTASIPTTVSRSSTISVDHHTLRSRLMALGEAPGPITETTFHVYLKRLRKLEKTTKINPRIATPRRPDFENQFTLSKNIPRNLLSTDWDSNFEKYRQIEREAFVEYARPISGRNYRGGVAKVSFNYLLLDPRITNDLPRTGGGLSLEERWKIFLEAIFYIGKGKSARPAAHLYDAFDIWTGKKSNNQPSQKLRTIMEIWRSGMGVVSLQVFSNSMQEEAFNREAAMIDTLGTANLSNCVRGQYYGVVSTMSIEKKKMLGKFLLYNAMQIFMHEGERQLFPRNVE